ncbi:MAG TPA: TRZ/ATZ family hydrolase [Casimicrobiaceae bacterium]|nr:TRZ/ATZ family hydrolase [Casimicrobiaceae bacterium]
MTSREPRAVDLRIDARFVIPVEPAGTLTDHALVVDAGRIVALVPFATADREYAPRERVVLPDHVLIPGLVNAHCHAAMTLLRGVADDVPLKAWLEEHIWPREARFVAPDFVHDGTLLATAEMLRAGITCCNDMYFYPDAAAQAYEEAGMRAMIGMPILDLPTPYAADADGYLQRGFTARDAFKHVPRLAFSLAPHAPYTVSDDTWRSVVVYARQLDLIVQTHLAETRREVDEARATSRESPLARLDRLGATGPSFVAIHAVHVDARDIELLAGQGCHVVHCAGSNMKLASGIAPVAALLAHGVNVALGTDGAASNNRLDMLDEMRLASLAAKVQTGDAAALPASTLLRMATLAGAAALGLDARIGSLLPGKDADVTAVRLADVETLPLYDPVSQLVNAAGREHVTDVWVAGERLLDERRLPRIDTQALVSRARMWQARLA